VCDQSLQKTPDGPNIHSYIHGHGLDLAPTTIYDAEDDYEKKRSKTRSIDRLDYYAAIACSFVQLTDVQHDVHGRARLLL
jgi:hypothetical protein